MKHYLGLFAVAAIALGLTACNTTTAPTSPAATASTPALADNYGYSLAVKRDGNVWAWGDNSNGQLGDGTTTSSSVPVQVVGPGGTGTLGAVVSVAAGGGSAYAVKSDGSLWAWGTATSSNVPVQVFAGTLSGVTAVAAASHHLLALESNGSVWAWGANNYGQLGNGTSGTTGSSVPVQVMGPGGTGTLSGVSSMAATGFGSQHALVLKANGSVWAWGNNSNGQLGDNTTTSRSAPVEVVGPGLTLSGVEGLSLHPSFGP